MRRRQFRTLLLRNYTKQFISRAPLCFANTLCGNAIPKHHSLFFATTHLRYSFTLRSMLYNARTEQFLNSSELFYALTVQIHNITGLYHVSSKLCFSISEQCISQALPPNSKTFQDLALSPLHDATTKKCFAIPLHVESVPLLSQSAP